MPQVSMKKLIDVPRLTKPSDGNLAVGITESIREVGKPHWWATEGLAVHYKPNIRIITRILSKIE